jgi:hypothetical protein
LDQFDVAFAPGELPALVATRLDPTEAPRWAIRNLEIGCDEYKAAVAVEGGNWHLEIWDWQ